jgi:hypothetical protein
MRTHLGYKYPYTYHFQIPFFPASTSLAPTQFTFLQNPRLSFLNPHSSLLTISAFFLPIMQLIIFVATLLASVVSARSFTLYDGANFGGAAHGENRDNDNACCMPIHLLINRGSVIDKA